MLADLPHRNSEFVEFTPAASARLKAALASKRGLLSLWPADVVCVVNGQPVTTGDILCWKRERQARILAAKRSVCGSKVVPCFVWVFDNGPIIPYGGPWLYVRTLKNAWCIDRIGWERERLMFRIMGIFPCGYLPTTENYRQWQKTFMEVYHRPTEKRPYKSGMAQAWAIVDAGGMMLLDVYRERPNTASRPTAALSFAGDVEGDIRPAPEPGR